MHWKWVLSSSVLWCLLVTLCIVSYETGRGRRWIFRNAKGDKKVEINLEVLVGLGVFVVSTLSLFHVIGFLNSLLNLPSWYLIIFLKLCCLSISQFFFLCSMYHHRFQWTFAPLSRFSNLRCLPWAHVWLYLGFWDQVALPLYIFRNFLISLRLDSCEYRFMINGLLEDVVFNWIHLQFGSEGV